jgi:hypothetical protein
MKKAALVALCLTVGAGLLTANGADASTVDPASPLVGSVDGLNAPVWSHAPQGFAPGSNPSSGAAGEFLSATAQEQVRSASRQDATTTARSDTDASALFGCNPDTGADDPHTSTSGGWAVSAHGWWNKGSCSSSTAHVTARLYEWYTNGESGGWVFKAQSGPTSKRPKNDGGGRVTVRKDCESSDRTDWLNVVDVDVDGQVDNSELGEGQEAVACRVWS